MLRTMPHRRSATALRRVAEGESERTILIALFANMVIAVAKLIGGLVSGSTGMLAEAAHSAADSVNEIFLGWAFIVLANLPTRGIRSAMAASDSCGLSWRRSHRF